jgi:hypothetical protein
MLVVFSTRTNGDILPSHCFYIYSDQHSVKYHWLFLLPNKMFDTPTPVWHIRWYEIYLIDL